MGQGMFKKHSKFQNFDETFYCRDQAQEHEFECQYTRTYFKIGKYGIEPA